MRGQKSSSQRHAPPRCAIRSSMGLGRFAAGPSSGLCYGDARRPSRNQAGNCRPYRRIRDEPSGFFGDPHLQWPRGHPIVLPWTSRAESITFPRTRDSTPWWPSIAPLVAELAVRHSEIVRDLDTPGDLEYWQTRRIRTVILRPKWK